MNTSDLKPYSHYKPSGVEWLGDMPALTNGQDRYAIPCANSSIAIQAKARMEESGAVCDFQNIGLLAHSVKDVYDRVGFKPLT